MGDMKYGKITTEKKTIPDGEPFFLLRGQDRLAPLVVEFYALLLEEKILYGAPQAAQDVRKIAQRMREWPVKKMPD